MEHLETLTEMTNLCVNFQFEVYPTPRPGRNWTVDVVCCKRGSREEMDETRKETTERMREETEKGLREVKKSPRTVSTFVLSTVHFRPAGV